MQSKRVHLGLSRSLYLGIVSQNNYTHSFVEINKFYFLQIVHFWHVTHPLNLFLLFAVWSKSAPWDQQIKDEPQSFCLLPPFFDWASQKYVTSETEWSI